jgi:hypothetical protein
MVHIKKLTESHYENVLPISNSERHSSFGLFKSPENLICERDLETGDFLITLKPDRTHSASCTTTANK